MAKYKRMTKKEKEYNAKFKKEMQKKGIIPPDKKKLNRKKYVQEALDEWNSKDKEFYAWDVYLLKAISIMLGKVDRNLRVTQEAVGVAKCLKLAIRLKEFSDKIESDGRETYTLEEQINYIKDILDA